MIGSPAGDCARRDGCSLPCRTALPEHYNLRVAPLDGRVSSLFFPKKKFTRSCAVCLSIINDHGTRRKIFSISCGNRTARCGCSTPLPLFDRSGRGRGALLLIVSFSPLPFVGLFSFRSQARGMFAVPYKKDSSLRNLSNFIAHKRYIHPAVFISIYYI